MNPSTAVALLYPINEPTLSPLESPVIENDELAIDFEDGDDGDGESVDEGDDIHDGVEQFRILEPSSYSWFECVMAAMALFAFCAVSVSALCVAVSCVRCCYRCRCVDVDELAEPRMTRVVPMSVDMSAVYSPLRKAANSNLRPIPIIFEHEPDNQLLSEAGTPFASPQAKKTQFTSPRSPRIRTVAF